MTDDNDTSGDDGFAALPTDWQDRVRELRRESAHYRDRATKAEQKHAEVKQRYDESAEAMQQAGQRIDEANKLKDEYAQLQDNYEAALAQSAQHETDLGKLRAAVEAGLPADMADRLRGENNDEWSEDAKTLSEQIKPAPRYVDYSQGKGGANGNGTAPLNSNAIEDGLRTVLGMDS